MTRLRTIQTTCILFVIAVASFASAQETLTVGEVSAKPGEKVSGFIRVPAGEDGLETAIPVALIRGTEPGPVLGLMAGIHGCEYASILAMQRIHRELDPQNLSGTVIMVLIAHVPEFLKRTEYYNPYDWKNLNRQFPGKADGTMTERIAYQITTQVIDHCDVFIDDHGGDAEDLAPFIFCTDGGNPEADAKMKALAEIYGIPILYNDHAPQGAAPKYSTHTAQMRGIPAITVESGKQGVPAEEDIVRVVRGTRNVLRFLHMIPGTPVKPARTVWVTDAAYVRAEQDGIFYPLVKSEQKVRKGEKIGTVTDFFGNVVQEVRAPIGGMILYIICSPPVNKGETLFEVIQL